MKISSLYIVDKAEKKRSRMVTILISVPISVSEYIVNSIMLSLGYVEVMIGEYRQNCDESDLWEKYSDKFVIVANFGYMVEISIVFRN